jgi:hypothetical protein
MPRGDVESWSTHMNLRGRYKADGHCLASPTLDPDLARDIVWSIRRRLEGDDILYHAAHATRPYVGHADEYVRAWTLGRHAMLACALAAWAKHKTVKPVPPAGPSSDALVIRAILRHRWYGRLHEHYTALQQRLERCSNSRGQVALDETRTLTPCSDAMVLAVKRTSDCVARVLRTPTDKVHDPMACTGRYYDGSGGDDGGCCDF